MGVEREIDPELCDIDFDELHLDEKPFSDGAYSKVYKAFYKSTIVCAKLIPKDMDQDDDLFHLYFEREIQVSRELDHANIVKYYGAGQDSKYFYLLTEYVPGGNMRSFIKHRRGLPWDLKIHIAIGIAQGLQYMHSKNILHRDIKSENFLVGDNWQIKICDFGFAKVINGDITRKAAHSICGTEEYMAPEMLMGLDYNDKVDIFSYGIFLAELITQCYLPTDLVRTPATQFGLNGLAFKELLPVDCPLPLADLVIDCCNYVTSNRPTLERIIHKLYDIKEVLPRFNIGNPSTQDRQETHRRKNPRNAPDFQEELMTISHFQVEESEEESEEEEIEEIRPRIVFEEIKFPEFPDPDEIEIHVPAQPARLQIFKLPMQELYTRDLLDDELRDNELDELNMDEPNEGELTEDELNEDELNEDELKEDELKEDELNEDELNEDELNEDEINEDELQEPRVHSAELRDYELLDSGELHEEEGELREVLLLEDEFYGDEFHDAKIFKGELRKSPVDFAELQDDTWSEEGEDVDWPHSYEIITTTTKRHREPEPEEEFPEMQFSECQISVVDYDEGEILPPALVEELLSPRRPQIGGSQRRKPALQHWESRELLENKLEREFLLAREFVHARRELPELTPRTRANSKAKPKPKPAPVPAPEPEPEPAREPEPDLDMDLDMEGLQMESFIVFEYPILDDEREESNFNFAETFTSKSNKYSCFYH